jgi:hypothetical protein
MRRKYETNLAGTLSGMIYLQSKYSNIQFQECEKVTDKGENPEYNKYNKENSFKYFDF